MCSIALVIVTAMLLIGAAIAIFKIWRTSGGPDALITAGLTVFPLVGGILVLIAPGPVIWICGLAAAIVVCTGIALRLYQW